MYTKSQSKTIKKQTTMTVIAPSEEIELAQNLEIRNEYVEKAYQNIVRGCKELLTAFEALRYRTSASIDHTKSGKETNLVSEWICPFWNITLTRNRHNYTMIYVSYDEDALTRFGDKLFNRMLRVVMKCTNYEAFDFNIENSIRIDHQATDIQPFFISRVLNGEKEHVSITAEDKVPS
jgi:hypothetical protein